VEIFGVVFNATKSITLKYAVKPLNQQIRKKISMTEKSQRIIDLEAGIAQAVAILDQSDGSRISTAEAIDDARNVLKDAFSVGFEKAVSEYVDSDNDSDDDSEDDETDSE
jgi:hypothetical protein